ncbi:MAG: FAD-dependent oxidoreductase [Myxococcales bacterium]|nr:FAD-dependent oxidoreductase [Myxococcales bacterium]
MECLIIGGDAAGMSAAVQIRRRRPDWTVSVLERGAFTSYAACGIPYLIAGDVPALDDLIVMSPETLRKERGVDVRTGWEATAIDTERRRLTARTPDGETMLAWDRLLIATGAEPILPPWPGMALDGVTSLRTLVDAERVLRQLGNAPRRVAIIGAGYVGLEMAEAFARRGLDVTVIEKQSGVMGGGEPALTDRVQREFEAHGVALRLETTVEGFEGDAGHVRAVATDGGAIEADLALVALGVRPRARLAREAGIALGESGAIRVDERQHTNAEGVFAAGDCAEAWHRVLEQPVYVPLALGANRQGRVAGANMADGDERFPGIIGSAVTRVFDLAIGRCGIDAREAERAGIAVRSAEAEAGSRAHYMPDVGSVWVKILFRADDHRVVGATLAGHDPCLGKRSDIIGTAISAGMSVEQLADLDLSYAPPFAPVWDPILQVANKARFALAKES